MFDIAKQKQKQGNQTMNTSYVKEDFIEENSRRRESVGAVIVQLATVFAMFCVLATLVMILGK